MKLTVLSLILFASCATVNQERTFWIGDNICYQNAEKTLCTNAYDPGDPVHLVDGFERETETPKKGRK